MEHLGELRGSLLGLESALRQPRGQEANSELVVFALDIVVATVERLLARLQSSHAATPIFAYALPLVVQCFEYTDPVASVEASMASAVPLRMRVRARTVDLAKLILDDAHCTPLNPRHFLSIVSRLSFALERALADLDDTTVLALCALLLACFQTPLQLARSSNAPHKDATVVDRRLALTLINSLAKDASLAESLGHVLSTLLDVLRAPKGASRKAKLTAVCLIRLIVSQILHKSRTIAAFLPATASVLSATVTGDQRIGHALIAECTLALGDLVPAALADSSFDTSPVPPQLTTFVALKAHLDHEQQRESETTKSADATLKTEAWLQQVQSRLVPMLERVCALARTHDHPTVRTAASRLATSLLHHCRWSLAPALGTLVATLVQNATGDDDDEAVAANTVPAQLEEGLYEQATRLPRLARTSIDDPQLLAAVQLVRNYCRLLRARLLTLTRGNSPLLRRLADALLCLLELPTAPDHLLMLETTPAGSDAVHAAETVARTDASLATRGRPHLRRFTHFRDPRILTAIESIVHELATHGDCTAITDLFIDEHRRQPSLPAPILLLNMLLTTTTTNSSVSSSSIRPVVLRAFPIYLALAAPALPSSLPPLLQCLACDGLQLALASLVTLPRDYARHLVRALYPLLQLAASTTAIVSWAAVYALQRLADADPTTPSLAALLDANADYIVDQIARRIRLAATAHPEAPLILCELLRRAGAAVVPLVEDTLDEIFAALDGQRDTAHAYLRVLQALVEAAGAHAEHEAEGKQTGLGLDEPKDEAATMARWPWDAQAVNEPVGYAHAMQMYYRQMQQDVTREERSAAEDEEEENAQPSNEELEEEEEEEEEEDGAQEKALPRELVLVRRVMLKSRHALSSDARVAGRRRVVALMATGFDLFGRSARADALLPLVHTLWSSLRPVLADTDLVTRTALFRCLAVLLRHCGDFMRTRARDVIPAVVRVLAGVSQGEARKAHSRAQQLVLETLTLVEQLARHMRLDAEDHDALLAALLPWLAHADSHTRVACWRPAALAAAQALAHVDPDATWLALRIATAPITLTCSHLPDVVFRAPDKVCLSLETARLIIDM